MNRIEKNAVDSKAIATKMVKKAIKDFNEGNRGCVTEMIKIEKGVRFRVDGWVISDDDTCKYGVVIKPQIIEGRAYRDYAQTTKTICDSIEREKAFGAFYEAVIETISNAIDQTNAYDDRLSKEVLACYTPEVEGNIVKIHKVDGWMLNNLTEDFFELSGDGVVTIRKDEDGDIWLSIFEYGSYILNNDGRKVNQEITKGLKWLVEIWGTYKSVKDCGQYWEVEKPILADEISPKNDRPMLDELVENDTPMLEDDEITDKEKTDMTIRDLFEREYDDHYDEPIWLRNYEDEFLTGKELDDFRKMASCTDGCYLELGKDEDGDLCVCGNESAYMTYYDDDYPIVDVYRDMMENMKAEIDEFFKKDNDRELGYRVWSFDNCDAYMKIVNYGWDYGLKFDIGTDGYRGNYVDVA